MSSKQQTLVATNATPLAIIPRTLDEVLQIARGVHGSGLAPKDMNTVEKITVAILTGLELHLPPMYSIQKIAVINGRPCIWGDAVPALLWARGFDIEETFTGSPETNDMVCTCTVTRPNGKKITRTFSVKQAITAALWGKAIWKQYPDRMLQMRARGYAARDGAADVMGGLYLVEELQGTIIDVTPNQSPETPDLPDPGDDQKDTDADNSSTGEATTSETATNPVEDEAPAGDDGEDEQLRDPDGFLEALEASIEACGDQEELNEVIEMNLPILARLPEAHRVTAKKLMDDAQG